jgi:protein-disulfide isomerase
MFVAAAAGTALSLALWLRQMAGTDGCAGDQPGTSGPCRDLLSQYISGTFVSIPALGYLFYLAIALALLLVVAPDTAVQRFGRWMLRAGLILGGSVSFGLFAVQLREGRFCAGCISSDLLVAALMGLSAPSGVWRTAPREAPAFGLSYAIPAALLLGCASNVAVLACQTRHYASRQSTMDLTQVRALISVSIKEQLKRPPGNENAKPSLSALNVEEWVEPALSFPSQGEEVRVIMFLDPNCPHCKDSFTVAEALAKRYEKEAKVYIIGRPLWRKSTLQMQALGLARKSGKYLDMWRAQFANVKADGMNFEDIKGICEQLGIPVSDLADRLKAENDAIEDRVTRTRAMGINFSPAVFINGMPLARGVNSDSQITEAIEKALKQKRHT